MRLPAKYAKSTRIDIGDIAEPSAIFLRDFDNRKNRAFVVAGRENLDFAHVAGRIRELSGGRIACEPIGSLGYILCGIRRAPPLGMALVTCAPHFSPRLEREPAKSETHKDLTGKDPTTIDELIKENHEVFANRARRGAKPGVGDAFGVAMVYHFRHRSANCFLVESRSSGKLLAVDTGWPCSLREYQRNLKSLGLRFADLRWAIVTHFHMDHAGLIGEFQLNGISCLVFENQEPAIDAMELTIRKSAEYPAYVPIDKGILRSVATGDFNEELRRLGVDGAVAATPGHSPDSVSFLTGDNEAIIGDLPPPDQLAPEDRECLRSWEILRERGAKTIYPSHAGFFVL